MEDQKQKIPEYYKYGYGSEYPEHQVADEYQILIGPDNKEVCCLTEPEDRTFGRDLYPVVKLLNQLYYENLTLKAALRAKDK